MLCTKLLLTRFSSRPGVYNAWSAWKNVCLDLNFWPRAMLKGPKRSFVVLDVLVVFVVVLVIAGCSRWLFTIANWNCHKSVSVIIWFCNRRILALLNKFWNFDFFLSGKKSKKRTFSKLIHDNLSLIFDWLNISRIQVHQTLHKKCQYLDLVIMTASRKSKQNL